MAAESKVQHLSLNNLPDSIKKITPFVNISNDLNKLFEDPQLFQNLLEFVLGYKYPKTPGRKTHLVFNYMNYNVYSEVERIDDDEKSRTDINTKYMTKFSSDYLTYHMNSIISEEKELRITTWDLPVLDNFFENLKNKRYGFLPLTLHARDTPNSNKHYLMIILDYETDKFYLFDSRNTNDYLYRSNYLPKDALEQFMIGLTQYKPFQKPFQYVPMAEWLGNQLQTVVHRNKWDSIYSLAWCLLLAMWLDSDTEKLSSPEVLMVELNNGQLELDKQNFIHEFIKNLLLDYKAHLNGTTRDNKSDMLSLEKHILTKQIWRTPASDIETRNKIIDLIGEVKAYEIFDTWDLEDQAKKYESAVRQRKNTNKLNEEPDSQRMPIVSSVEQAAKSSSNKDNCNLM